MIAVNQDSPQSSWLKWIKQLFRSLSSDSSQLTPEEKKLSQLLHLAASLSFLIFWWACFQLFLAISMAHFQQWQLCENNRSPANATLINLTKQQDQINGTIDILRTATASQKIRLRQQIAEVIRIIDSDCQMHLYFISQQAAFGAISTGAAIVLTVTFGHTASRGIQQANRLTLNLAGTALLLLTTTVSMNTFLNNSKNSQQTGTSYLKARILLNTFATDLVNPSISLATPAKLESWMQVKDQAIQSLLVVHLNFNDTLTGQTLTQYLPNTARAPLPAAPAPQPAAAAQP
jgi:hypothetical protein